MISKDDAIAIFESQFELYNKLENGPIEEDFFDVEIREIKFSKKDIADKLHIKSKQVEDLIEQMEENGEYFVRNNSNQYTMSQEQATQLTKLAGKKTIPEIRQSKSGKNFIVPVVIVNTAKGGIAKTTTAIHLAVAAALDFVRDQRVILIDGDPQGSVVKQLAPIELATKFNTLLSMIEANSDLSREERLKPEKQEEIRNVLVNEVLLDTYLDNLRLVPSDFCDTAIELIIQNQLTKDAEAAKNIYNDLVVTPLTQEAELIIIDTSPSPNATTNNQYYAANHVALCTTGRKQDYRSFIAHHQYMVGVMKQAPESFGGYLSIKTIVTKHIDNNTKLSQAMKKNIARVNSVSDVHMAIIHENVKYEEASDEKLPLQLFNSANDKPYKTAIKEIDDLYNSFIENINIHLFEE